MNGSFPNDKNFLMLAPMAGITDSPFRILSKKGGAQVVFTEMLSSMALAHDSRRTTAMLRFSDEERPIIAQIFGSNTIAIEKSVGIIAQLGFDGVNLNFGCPARKIMKSSSGSAALKDLNIYKEVIRAACKAAEPLKIPVSVKTRPGITPRKNLAAEVSKIAEGEGASMIILHARFASQKHSGYISYEALSSASRCVKIPVVANGGISDEETAHRILTETGCRGIMIGRAAIGDFGIFGRILHYIKTGEKLPAPSREEKINMYKQHARLSCGFYGEKRGIIILRKLAAFYLKGMPGAKSARELINKSETLEDFNKALDTVFNFNVNDDADTFHHNVATCHRGTLAARGED